MVTMTLISIVAALLLEQARPLSVSRVDAWLGAWARFLDSQLNAGERHHGLAAWAVGAALPTLAVLVVFVVLVSSNWLAAVLFSIAILYLTTGFRQFSHYFTDIHLALRMGEIERARQLLADWRGVAADRLNSGEIARLAIEEALMSSYHHVFAPLFWFVLLGPAGALLYRLARYFCYSWGKRSATEFGRFGEFSRRAFAVVDWLPVRLTAVAFAVVGDFEDAVSCWRIQAGRWPEQASGILLSSGAGALGVRLGMPVPTGGDLGERPELGVGDEADPDLMQSTVGLVWRTLVVALLLLTLLGLAGWVGK
jgi:adenosylcobinamide-phosphate synthase